MGIEKVEYSNVYELVYSCSELDNVLLYNSSLSLFSLSGTSFILFYSSFSFLKPTLALPAVVEPSIPSSSLKEASPLVIVLLYYTLRAELK